MCLQQYMDTNCTYNNGELVVTDAIQISSLMGHALLILCSSVPIILKQQT